MEKNKFIFLFFFDWLLIQKSFAYSAITRLPVFLMTLGVWSLDILNFNYCMAILGKRNYIIVASKKTFKTFS